jgi:hypothetical protein
VYFLKHSQFWDKEYQHRVPEAWQEPGATPGRFWGYWGLRKHTATVEVSRRDGVLAGRTLRRWSIAQQVTREVTRPRVKGGRVTSKYPEVIGLAGAQLVESRPAPKYRKTRIRARRMPDNRGFVSVNDGPAMASQLARYLDQRGGIPGSSAGHPSRLSGCTDSCQVKVNPASASVSQASSAITPMSMSTTKGRASP